MQAPPKRFMLRTLCWMLGLLVVAGLGIAVWGRNRPGWQTPLAARHLTHLPGELFFIEAPGLARRGSDRLAVVRLDGSVRVVPQHFRALDFSSPMSIDQWADKLGAPLIINAGQFDSAKEHLGWLRSQGRWLRQQRHPGWLALLVNQPSKKKQPHPVSATATTIIDLAVEKDIHPEAWENAMQSMMLFDANGSTRIRQTDQTASRTVLAIDRQGRLLVILSEGAVTLYDLAQFLRRHPLDLVRAMNLDGGIESQLALRDGDKSMLLFGHYGVERTSLWTHHVIGHATLPSVVAIYPAP